MTVNRGAYKKIPQVQIQDLIIDVIDVDSASRVRTPNAALRAAMRDFMGF